MLTHGFHDELKSRKTMKTQQIPWIALALFVSGCSTPIITAENASQGAGEFTTDTVKRQDIVGYSFFDGKLFIPESAQATVYSPYDTPVLAVMTGAGQHVGRGEAIIKLTIPGADTAESSARASSNSAKATYSAEKGDNAAPVREAKRVLAEAQVAEKAARRSIANGGEADMEAAIADRIGAEAALKVAQREYRQSLQPSRDSMDQAAVSLQDAQADASKGTVRSPIAGTVVMLTAQEGMMATARQALATIVDFDAVRVQGLVPAELQALVVKGSSVIVAMNGANSDPLDGTVTDVSVAPPTEGQKGAGYLAVIRFLKPRAMLLPSLSVKRVGVKSGSASGVLVVPVGAVSTVRGKSTVSVKNGDIWVTTPVEVGLTDGARVEIKSGLTEGSIVRVHPPQQDPERK